MKHFLPWSLWIFAGTTAGVLADTYANFIRQTQYPSNVTLDVSVASSGEQLSGLPLEDGGALFDLYAVNSDTLVSYLLDSKYVGAYVPKAEIVITSEDPYTTVPRTRADRPFYVKITVSNLLSGDDIPAAAKQVTFLHHVQSYGDGGTGANLDRTQATLISQETITTELAETRTYAYSVVPATNVAKIRGEERFSVYTIQDTGETYSIAPSQLASQYIQIWPVPDGTITGLTNGATYKDLIPAMTFRVNDVYPGSQIYAQAYKGEVSGSPAETIRVGAASAAVYEVPTDAEFSNENLSSLLPTDGRWTVELISSSVFGLERLAYVTFDVDRTISVRGMVTAE
ncbi:MAG: hypothetical protein QM680_14420 [Luteolibacter sp.]